MKTAVVYDSVYGNTEKIAKAVGSSISDEARVFRARDVKDFSLLSGFDLIVVGSPTHAGGPSKDLKKFLEIIPRGALSGKKTASFDTRIPVDGQGIFIKLILNFFGYAAPKIQKALEKKGGEKAAEPAGFIVKGKEGPLAEGELERAFEWGKTIAEKTGN